MTTLSIHTYGTSRTAEHKVGLLEHPVGRRISADAAVVSWPATADRPTAWQASLISGPGTLSGAFWGLLFAHLFLIPLSYAEPPSVPAQYADRSLDPLGLTASHLAAIRTLVGPGTSAVLALHADDDLDALAAVLAGDRSERAEIVFDAVQSRRLVAGFSEATG